MNTRDLYAIGGFTAVISEAVGAIYRRALRPNLPQKNRCAKFAGIKVPSVEVDGRIFDESVPWMTPTNRKWHEYDLIRAAKSIITEGDSVLVVGGGTGAGTVHFAQYTGASGRLRVFEASPEQAEVCRKTVEANEVPCPVNIRNQTVGEVISLYGDDTAADTISPTELPKADVIILDCEGAEKEILGSEADLPNRVVVETHGVFEAPTDEIQRMLKDRGYSVKCTGVENLAHDVRILTARC